MKERDKLNNSKPSKVLKVNLVIIRLKDSHISRMVVDHHYHLSGTVAPKVSHNNSMDRELCTRHRVMEACTTHNTQTRRMANSRAKSINLVSILYRKITHYLMHSNRVSAKPLLSLHI